MPATAHLVERHYGRAGLLERILDALRAAGKDPARLAADDLAPVDEFHIRGREATVERVQRAQLHPGQRVLDVGRGLGGSARHLAAEHRCRVGAIDLTPTCVDLARELTRRIGLAGDVDHRVADALALPFDDAAFDLVRTEHVQMNVEDKHCVYAEIARVLRPRGRLAFHDFLRGPAGEPPCPVPWAADASTSFVVSPQALRQAVQAAGLRVVDGDALTRRSADWPAERMGQPVPPPLGVHLPMGPDAKVEFANVLSGLHDGRLQVVQAVAEKPA